MDIFFTLIAKIMPLYAFMGAGFLFGRRYPALAAHLAPLQIYAFIPVVMLTTIMSVDMRPAYLTLPLLSLAFCVTMAGFMFFITMKWRGPDRYVLASMAGSGNTGYFGLPVALILFTPHQVGLYMLLVLGFVIYENTVGYYVLARGQYTVADSLRRLLRLPPLYAALLGIILGFMQVETPDFLQGAVRDLRGCYIVLGMMIVGVALSSVRIGAIDWFFTHGALVGKFLLWPFLACLFILFDRIAGHFYGPEIAPLVLLIALAPLPANWVTYSVQLGLPAEKVAWANFISTLVALALIPLVFSMLPAFEQLLQILEF